MTRREERVIEALVRTARPMMRRGVTERNGGRIAWRQDSCIAACRIGQLALAEFQIRAGIIGISYVIVNHAYRVLTSQLGRLPSEAEQAEAGAHSLGMGLEYGPDSVGHFGLTIGARLMVDLSADQVSRPAKGWTITEPVVANMPPGWRKGDERYMTHTESYTIGVKAEPDNKNFARSRDWTDLTRFRDVVPAIVAAMREDGAR